MYLFIMSKQIIEINGNAFGVLSAVFGVVRKPTLLNPPKASVAILAFIHLQGFFKELRALVAFTQEWYIGYRKRWRNN
jgi:hypothetical protein